MSCVGGNFQVNTGQIIVNLCLVKQLWRKLNFDCFPIFGGVNDPTAYPDQLLTSMDRVWCKCTGFVLVMTAPPGGDQTIWSQVQSDIPLDPPNQ